MKNVAAGDIAVFGQGYFFFLTSILEVLAALQCH